MAIDARGTDVTAMTKGVRARPNGSMGESFGSISPQVVDWSTPRTTAPRPVAARTEPTTSRRGFGPVRTASATKRVMARMPITMTTSPRKTTRHDSSVVAHPPTMD